MIDISAWLLNLVHFLMNDKENKSTCFKMGFTSIVFQTWKGLVERSVTLLRFEAV